MAQYGTTLRSCSIALLKGCVNLMSTCIQMLLHQYKKTASITGLLQNADTPMIAENGEAQWEDALHAMTRLGCVLLLVRSSGATTS